MTYFEFTKRFPDETSAINFIVSVKYKNGYDRPIDQLRDIGRKNGQRFYPYQD